jgi:hypothetical protein
MKTEEHRDTNLMTTWGIEDPKAVFRYAMPCEMAGTGILGIILR